MFKKVFILSLFFFLTGCGSDLKFEQTELSLASNIFTVDVADTRTEQAQGLSGREKLEIDEGMLFVYADKKILDFWMKDMLFPIDLLWIEDNTIVAWQENMPIPLAGASLAELPTYSSPKAVNHVLELPAGTIKRLALSVGDQVTWEY